MLLKKMIRILVLGASLISPGIWAAGFHDGGHSGGDTAETASGHPHGGMHADGHGHAQGGHMASAVGSQGDPNNVTRTIDVELLDSMRLTFSPALNLKRGDVVRFVVRNTGAIRHEFSIGSAAEQDAHRAMMRQTPDMVHKDPNSVTVDPGQTQDLVWAFNGEDQVVFACNIPGHSEAGMTTSVILAD